MVPTSVAIRQYRFVVMGNAGTIAEAASAGVDAVGVSQEASATGSLTAIPLGILDGTIQTIEAGAAISVAAAIVPIASDAQGRAITATTGHAILGYALQTAGGAGEAISFISTKPARASA